MPLKKSSQLPKDNQESTVNNSREQKDKKTKVIDFIRAIIRPFLAISFTIGAIVLTFMDELPAEVIGTAATTIAAFYFGERSALKRPDEKRDEISVKS